MTAIPQGQPVLTPDVKQMIADEVRRQIALENAEAQQNAQNTEPDPASSGIARMLADNASHVFVVGASLDLLDSTGQECAVSEGDVLQLATPPPPNATAANVIVMGGKGGSECRKGSAVAVDLADLQNMQNHMRETLDAGLSDLQAHKNGLPAPPQAAPGDGHSGSLQHGCAGCWTQPPPRRSRNSSRRARPAEQAALGSATTSPFPRPQAPPFNLSMGLTTDQVVAGMGQPKQIVDLGAKKVYVYDNLKITFNNGKVTDVE